LAGELPVPRVDAWVVVMVVVLGHDTTVSTRRGRGVADRLVQSLDGWIEHYNVERPICREKLGGAAGHRW
jgi:hypothetical protein